MKYVMICILFVFFIWFFIEAKLPEAKESLPLREIVTGAWVVDIQDCEKSPPFYSFSKNGLIMYVDSDEGVYLSDKNKLNNRLIYNVISESENIIRTSIEGEDRFTDSGKAVLWDLVVKDKNHFCWHRADWPLGSCTKTLTKCKSDS